MRAAAPELVDALEPVYVAETEAEREAVFSFRYTVYAAELSRSSATPTTAGSGSTTRRTTSRTPRCSTPTTAPAG